MALFCIKSHRSTYRGGHSSLLSICKTCRRPSYPSSGTACWPRRQVLPSPKPARTLIRGQLHLDRCWCSHPRPLGSQCKLSEVDAAMQHHIHHSRFQSIWGARVQLPHDAPVRITKLIQMKWWTFIFLCMIGPVKPGLEGCGPHWTLFMWQLWNIHSKCSKLSGLNIDRMLVTFIELYYPFI